MDSMDGGVGADNTECRNWAFCIGSAVCVDCAHGADCIGSADFFKRVLIAMTTAFALI